MPARYDAGSVTEAADPTFLRGVRPTPCKERPHLFAGILDLHSGTRVRAAAETVKWCQACPVRAACARFGVERQQSGIWGGVDLHLGRPFASFLREARAVKQNAA